MAVNCQKGVLDGRVQRQATGVDEKLHGTGRYQVYPIYHKGQMRMLRQFLPEGITAEPDITQW